VNNKDKVEPLCAQEYRDDTHCYHSPTDKKGGGHWKNHVFFCEVQKDQKIM
jgi:hypothetical protein